ncbi:DUF397 domain-containing protein [Streptomyces sp. ISL-96]|uniref:DUF397 domain-containing protein n=1 Tax=Streptomyces sp. ISL-96 TaxID=2819191 RepID=UPI001BE967AF|nr:DUF397 domain-containing protein [Streptomyces sp. ISL-96]MBT2493098.1 DUF397 domain-containing protein [Streptomyces sp. ISL-96]
MTQPLEWQKSSFSGAGDGGNCVELAATDDAVLLRESDAPAAILTTTPTAFAALIRAASSARATHSPPTL